MAKKTKTITINDLNEQEARNQLRAKKASARITRQEVDPDNSKEIAKARNQLRVKRHKVHNSDRD